MITGRHKLIFFWGVDKHYPSFFDPGEYFLVSAATLWSNQRGKFIRRSYDRRRMFIDSGGFSFFSKSGDYPFSPDEYISLKNYYQPLLWSGMDYPCEPNTSRSILRSNLDRIEATLDHLTYLSKFDDGGLLPVVQGYTINERLYCLEEIFKRGLAKRLIGIGSLCALPDGQAIDEIVTAIGQQFGSRCIFHLFGVTLNFLKRETIKSLPYIFSVDSSAWQYYSNYSELKNRYRIYKSKLSELIYFRN